MKIRISLFRITGKNRFRLKDTTIIDIDNPEKKADNDTDVFLMPVLYKKLKKFGFLMTANTFNNPRNNIKSENEDDWYNGMNYTKIRFNRVELNEKHRYFITVNIVGKYEKKDSVYIDFVQGDYSKKKDIHQKGLEESIFLLGNLVFHDKWIFNSILEYMNLKVDISETLKYIS